jgi:hypothetical protein
MRLARGRRRDILGVMRSARAMRTAMAAAGNGKASKQRRSGRSSLTLRVFTTCTATVWQWVEDCYHGSYEGAPADGSAWAANSERDSRVVRDGSWNSDPDSLRSASRDSHDTIARQGIHWQPELGGKRPPDTEPDGDVRFGVRVPCLSDDQNGP